MFRRPRRGIVWTEHAQRHALEFLDEYPRLYDVYRNLEWLLERRPDNPLAEQLDDKFWLIKSEAISVSNAWRVPSVTLIYHFDDSTVTFWDVRVEPVR